MWQKAAEYHWTKRTGNYITYSRHCRGTRLEDLSKSIKISLSKLESCSFLNRDDFLSKKKEIIHSQVTGSVERIRRTCPQPVQRVRCMTGLSRQTFTNFYCLARERHMLSPYSKLQTTQCHMSQDCTALRKLNPNICISFARRGSHPCWKNSIMRLAYRQF
jgi:hypothetical protein